MMNEWIDEIFFFLMNWKNIRNKLYLVASFFLSAKSILFLRASGISLVYWLNT